MIPTRDHKVIRWWASKHNAIPVEVKPLRFDSEPSILHFLIGGPAEGTPELRPISWDDFFVRFDLLGLSFTFDNESSDFDLVRVERRRSDDGLPA